MKRQDPDPQRERLYEWERSYVEPKCPPEIMSSDEIRGLVTRVSAMTDIAEPKVIFTSATVACKAFPQRNDLEIADWGRTKPTILHELAHLVSWPFVLAGDAPHGFAFTTVAIMLYNRFIGLDLQYLAASAASRHLAFDPRAIHAQFARERQEDFFPDEI